MLGSSGYRHNKYIRICLVQGDLSLDQYDDSQHSRHSIGGMGGSGFGAIGASAFGGTGGMRFPSPAPPPSAPWGSGFGGGGKSGLETHAVVPGGIWLPTPRVTTTQGTSSFSPSSSAGAGGGDGAGDGKGRDGQGGEGGGRSGGFFGIDEPRCDRCGSTDPAVRAQVSGGLVCRGSKGKKRDTQECMLHFSQGRISSRLKNKNRVVEALCSLFRAIQQRDCGTCGHFRADIGNKSFTPELSYPMHFLPLNSEKWYTLQSRFCSQMLTCGSCGKLFHTFCVGEKRIPYGLHPKEQRTRHTSFVAETFGPDWQCSRCQTQAAHTSPQRTDSYAPLPQRGFDNAGSSHSMATPSPRSPGASIESLANISPSKDDLGMGSTPSRAERDKDRSEGRDDEALANVQRKPEDPDEGDAKAQGAAQGMPESAVVGGEREVTEGEKEPKPPVQPTVDLQASEENLWQDPCEQDRNETSAYARATIFGEKVAEPDEEAVLHPTKNVEAYEEEEQSEQEGEGGAEERKNETSRREEIFEVVVELPTNEEVEFASGKAQAVPEIDRGQRSSEEEEGDAKSEGRAEDAESRIKAASKAEKSQPVEAGAESRIEGGSEAEKSQPVEVDMSTEGGGDEVEVYVMKHEEVEEDMEGKDLDGEEDVEESKETPTAASLEPEVLQSNALTLAVEMGKRNAVSEMEVVEAATTAQALVETSEPHLVVATVSESSEESSIPRINASMEPPEHDRPIVTPEDSRDDDNVADSAGATVPLYTAEPDGIVTGGEGVEEIQSTEDSTPIAEVAFRSEGCALVDPQTGATVAELPKATIRKGEAEVCEKPVTCGEEGPSNFTLEPTQLESATAGSLGAVGGARFESDGLVALLENLEEPADESQDAANVPTAGTVAADEGSSGKDAKAEAVQSATAAASPELCEPTDLPATADEEEEKDRVEAAEGAEKEESASAVTDSIASADDDLVEPPPESEELQKAGEVMFIKSSETPRLDSLSADGDLEKPNLPDEVEESVTTGPSASKPTGPDADRPVAVVEVSDTSTSQVEGEARSAESADPMQVHGPPDVVVAVAEGTAETVESREEFESCTVDPSLEVSRADGAVAVECATGAIPSDSADTPGTVPAESDSTPLDAAKGETLQVNEEKSDVDPTGSASDPILATSGATDEESEDGHSMVKTAVPEAPPELELLVTAKDGSEDAIVESEDDNGQVETRLKIRHYSLSVVLSESPGNVAKGVEEATTDDHDNEVVSALPAEPPATPPSRFARTPGCDPPAILYPALSPSSPPRPGPLSPVPRANGNLHESGTRRSFQTTLGAACNGTSSRPPLAIVTREEKSPGILFHDFPRSPSASGGSRHAPPSFNLSVPRSPKTLGPSSRGSSSPKSPRRPPLSRLGSHREVLETSKGPIWSPSRSPRWNSVAGTGHKFDLGSGRCTPKMMKSPSSSAAAAAAAAAGALAPSQSSTTPRSDAREGRTAKRDTTRALNARRSSSSSVVTTPRGSRRPLDPDDIGVERSTAFRAAAATGGASSRGGGSRQREDLSGGWARSKLRRVESLNNLSDNSEGIDSARSRDRSSSMSHDGRDGLGDDLAAIVTHLKQV